MKTSSHKISQTLLELASFSDTVLHVTPKARASMKSAKLDSTQRSLLERVDGFRSLEQLLAMSGDLIAVHAALGRLIAAGLVATDLNAETEDAPAVAAAAPVPAGKPKAAPAAPAIAPPSELENAKQLLMLEAKLALGKGAEKLRTRVEACRSIEEIYDLIVKVQEHLTETGKANPDVFLERLSSGLATARKKSSSPGSAP